MSTTSSPFSAPGIYVTTQLAAPPPSTSSPISPSVAGFLGQHYRGPSTPIQCNSWSDFIKFFGGFNPNATPVLANAYLPYAVYEFFANGGQQCWVYRAASSAQAGTSAYTTLIDQSATPQNTIGLTAGIYGQPGNVGTWGNSIYYSVSQNSSAAGQFNLTIYFGGSSANYTVEQWNDLSMNPQSSRYFLTVLNSTVQGSLYVVASNLNSPSAAPFNAPATCNATALVGGTDPADPSPGDYVNMLTYGNQAPAFVAPFDQVSGVMNINIPGLANTSGFNTGNVSTVLDQGINYCTTGRPFSFFVVDPPSGQTPAGVNSFVSSTINLSSSNAAVYYPWLSAQNPASSNLQATILLPPGGFVLGQMAQNDATQGVWTAPAGLNTTLDNVVQAERLLGVSDLGALNNNNVNGLRTRANGQVVIWGTRTLKHGYASMYVPVQRTLNYISGALVHLLEFAVFQPNDAVTWANVTSVCTTFLDGLLSAGAFPSSQASNAYYVTCNSSNNTQTNIAQGIMNVTVGVALVYPAEFINLLITQFQPAGTTTVSSTTVL